MTINNQTADFGTTTLRTNDTLKTILAGVGTLLFGVAVYYAAGILIADGGMGDATPGTGTGITFRSASCSEFSSERSASERSASERPVSERMLASMPSASCRSASELSASCRSARSESRLSPGSESESLLSRIDSMSSRLSTLS